MAAAMEAIGLVSGALGIIQFLMDNIPKEAEDSGTVVSIKVGLGDDNSSGMGGGITSVYGFDVHNDYLGSSKSGSIKTSMSADFTIAQAFDDRQAEYISVAGSDDAVCISWVSVSQHDGSDGGAWTGDIGYQCGESWYHGNQSPGHFKNPDGSAGDKYWPMCTWLDSDHTNGLKSGSLKFNVGAYGINAGDTVNNKQGCSSTIFSTDSGPIADVPAGKTTKRDLQHRVRPAFTENRLVVSKISNQTADQLCSHPNSVGPDFIGSCGYFCDMATKTLSPLCSTLQQDGCIQVTTNGTLTKRTSVARRSVDLVHKSYGTIDHWG